MKRLLFYILLGIPSLAYGSTLRSIAISPQGVAIQNGSTQQFTATCTYSDGTTDNCAKTGRPAWSSSRFTMLTVNSSGLATWAVDPGAGNTNMGYVVVTAGGLSDRAGVFGQHVGDSWELYPTPDLHEYQNAETNKIPPMTLAVGAIVSIGEGFQINGHNPNPLQTACNWTSSNTAVATVDRIGHVTGVSPGAVTITCGVAGNAVFNPPTNAGWLSPGNFVQLNVVAGGTGHATWYVRPRGGTIYVNATRTPHGQCTGKTDADYAGATSTTWLPNHAYALGALVADSQGNVEKVTTAGVSAGYPTWNKIQGGSTTDGTAVWTNQGHYPIAQACGVRNLRDLWDDRVSYEDGGNWVISGGDTVLVRQKPGGYEVGDVTSNTLADIINCRGVPWGCHMPSVPSGTAARHTRILGENYASCTATGAKTQLWASWNSETAIDIQDSQFVDAACFNISDQAACSNDGNFTHHCTGTDNFGDNGVIESALSSYDNLTDLNIHGMAGEGVRGASGVGLTLDRVRIAGNTAAGMDMDDTPWTAGNISVSGGLTMRNSLTEFSGCVEEYPIVHQYPYIECRDQNTGGYGDGFGTAATDGDWYFDHDIWRYNFQDGLDLLHSGMNILSVTNSQSYGEDGNAFKIGSGRTITFQNNFTDNNCNRIAYVFGDEPASAIVPGVSTCRAGGGGVVVRFDGQGVDAFQNNTLVGYGAVSYEIGCEGSWDACTHAKTTFENNAVLGYADSLYNEDKVASLFYGDSPGPDMPPNQGWAVRDHNLYYNLRHGCPKLLAGEVCANPRFIDQPPLSISRESVLDNYNFNPSANSPLIGAGIPLQGIATDNAGAKRPNRPSIGALESSGGHSRPTASLPRGTDTSDPASSSRSGIQTAWSLRFTAWYRRAHLYLLAAEMRWIRPCMAMVSSRLIHLLHTMRG